MQMKSDCFADARHHGVLSDNTAMEPPSFSRRTPPVELTRLRNFSLSVRLKNGAVSKFGQEVHLMHMREIKSHLNVSIGIFGDLLQVHLYQPRATNCSRDIKTASRIAHRCRGRGRNAGHRWRPLVADTSFKQSALNLAHYLAVRRHDLRLLQQALVPLGVSSLGRCEAHVLHTLDAVLATLAAIAGTSANRSLSARRVGALKRLLKISPAKRRRFVRFPGHVQCGSW